MNVLILGGNGYIGSKVARRLAQTGNTVVCTKRPSSDLSRLSDLGEKIRWISATENAVKRDIQQIQYDYVLNMVCNYGRGASGNEAVMSANLEFPLQVLKLSAEADIKNFLTIGTSLPPRLNIYSFSKHIFGEFGVFYSEKYGISFTSLLLEMFYGADEPEGRFLPSVIIRMLKGEPIDTTIGSQRRDIICADDVVKAVMLVMDKKLSGFHEIPVGTGEAPTISDILDFLWENTGKKSELHKGAIPMRANEPDCVADISMLRSLGTWEPVFWKDGLKQMISEMSNRYH